MAWLLLILPVAWGNYESTGQVQHASEAIFTVTVTPPDALVLIDDHKTEQTGQVRSFAASNLKSGSTYSQTFKAVWPDGMELSIPVEYQAGHRISVALNKERAKAKMPIPDYIHQVTYNGGIDLIGIKRNGKTTYYNKDNEVSREFAVDSILRGSTGGSVPDDSSLDHLTIVTDDKALAKKITEDLANDKALEPWKSKLRIQVYETKHPDVLTRLKLKEDGFKKANFAICYQKAVKAGEKSPRRTLYAYPGPSELATWLKGEPMPIPNPLPLPPVPDETPDIDVSGIPSWMLWFVLAALAIGYYFLNTSKKA